MYGYDYYDYGYRYSSGADTETVFAIIAISLAVIAAVLAFIFIMPKKKVARLNSFGYFVHNLCHFSTLLIDKIMKALYIVSTVFIIIFGFLNIFEEPLEGILMFIVGPIGVRIAYEFIMMAITTVQNISEIRKKICDDGKREEYIKAKKEHKASNTAFYAENPANAQAPETVFCAQCGTKYDTRYSECPNCHTPRI